MQNRVNSDISFNRTYEEYVNGFGDLNGNYWIGTRLAFKNNNLIFYITTNNIRARKTSQTHVL